MSLRANTKGLKGIVVLGLALIFGSCASREPFAQELQVLEQKVSTARKRGAYKCAAPELARASAHTAFAKAAWDHGNGSRAREHREVATRNADIAIATSEPSRCITEDRDKDGIVDPIDKCPDDPEDIDGFEDDDGCPDPDNDADGIFDVDDACPNDPGPAENKGCPDKDSDRDGLIDRNDDCPQQPGPKSNRGCPVADRDGDGINDDKDECPDVPGKPPTGCPAKVLVEVTKTEIKINDKIQFATGKAIIRGQISFMILDQVASVLKSNPKLKIVVEGHTDSVGSAQYNLRLSDRRAASVKRALIQRGVGIERLRSVGYGESQPLESNQTPVGRRANRRVQFRIIQADE